MRFRKNLAPPDNDRWRSSICCCSKNIDCKSKDSLIPTRVLVYSVNFSAGQ